MAQTDVTDPFAVKLLNRRKSSLTEHINRIRKANMKRQFAPLWSNVSEQKLFKKSVSGSKGKKSPSLNQVSQINKLHGEFVHPESSEDLSSIESDSRNFRISNRYRLSLDSDRVDVPKNRVIPANKMKTELSKVKKSIPDKSKKKEDTIRIQAENSNFGKGTQKKSTYMSNKSPPISRTRSKKRGQRKLNKKRNEIKSNINELSEENVKYRDHIDEITPAIMEKIMGPRKVSSKDTIILKWLHDLDCPYKGKEVLKEDGLNAESSKKNPIRILKRPLAENKKLSLNEKKATTKKISSTTNKKKTKKIPRTRKKVKTAKGKQSSVSEKKSVESKQNIPEIQELNKITESSSTESKKSSTKVKSNVNLSGSQINDRFETKSNTTTSTESSKGFDDVEFHISEPGKLQIVLNLKSLSPEDAAVIIWLDDIPKSVLEQIFTKRLTTSPLKGTQSAPKLEHSKREFSQSHLELEDTATPRPNIYFPSVTILKNIAVDSKVGLRNLKEDLSNSVYYKRCNLSHTDWEKLQSN